MRNGWWLCTLIGIATAAWPAPAQGTACTLHQGESSPSRLHQEEQHHQRRIQAVPGDVSSYCQLAHIQFKRAGSAPDEPGRLQAYSQCIDFTEAALARDPKAAAAYFLKGLCLGKRAEIKGVWSSLEMIQPFEDLMQRAAALDPGLDHGGPHRALGRYYFKLPWLLGGSLKKSIFHLEQAVRLGPNHFENLLFLAEAYYENGQEDPARDALVRLMEVTGPRAQEAALTAPLQRARALLNRIQTRTGFP